MLTAVVCGLLCGARGYEGLVEWLHDQSVDIWHWIGFTRRPPKKDAFRDLLIKLDPAELDRVVRQWVALDLGLSDETETLRGLSIDGKSLCATLRPYARAVHLLAAVDHQTGCVLSQMRVDEKTNEHKGALSLLQNLVLTGRVVVGDAMFCQRDLCEQVLDAGGDYLIAVKENQPTLLREIALEFTAEPAAFSPSRTATASCRATNSQHAGQGPRSS
jgi:predicted transposase YbfD/YdcC